MDHLRCDTCGEIVDGWLAGEAHSALSGHIDFVEVTREAQNTLRVQASASASGSTDQASDLEELNLPRTGAPLWTQDELSAKEKFRQEYMHLARKRKACEEIERARIRQKIEQDRARRRQDGGLSPSLHRGTPANPVQILSSSVPEAGPPGNVSMPSWTKLRLRVLGSHHNPVVKTFPVEAKLSDVAEAVRKELGVNVAAIVHTTVPPKTWAESSFDTSLRDAGLAQNGSLTVKPKAGMEPLTG
ncbi:hypothetical protein DL769_006107 [Monosporascus sp. CRB-8-3]|nr:hypothetical protein DL769_006107 [Monosporascus sp. CRB-8-3]